MGHPREGAAELDRVQPYVRVTRDDAGAARRWIVEGDIGAITFNACCQWLDWPPRVLH
jgi:hypothetical protein